MAAPSTSQEARVPQPIPTTSREARVPKPVPTTSQGRGVPANATPGNTGARPKQPEGQKKKRRAINTIAESLDAQFYDEFTVPEVVKEYKASFTNSDGNEKDIVLTNQPPDTTGRRRRQDVVEGPVKVPLGKAQNANTPLSAWECFFDDRIITQIIRLTNLRIQRDCSLLPRTVIEDNRYTWIEDTNGVELQALIGLCYLRGVL